MWAMRKVPSVNHSVWVYMLAVVPVSASERKCWSRELVIRDDRETKNNLSLSPGPIGLVSMLAAKAMGAETIIITGRTGIRMCFSIIELWHRYQPVSPWFREENRGQLRSFGWEWSAKDGRQSRWNTWNYAEHFHRMLRRWVIDSNDILCMWTAISTCTSLVRSRRRSPAV